MVRTNAIIRGRRGILEDNKSARSGALTPTPSLTDSLALPRRRLMTQYKSSSPPRHYSPPTIEHQRLADREVL